MQVVYLLHVDIRIDGSEEGIKPSQAMLMLQRSRSGTVHVVSERGAVLIDCLLNECMQHFVPRHIPLLDQWLCFGRVFPFQSVGTAMLQLINYHARSMHMC